MLVRLLHDLLIPEFSGKQGDVVDAVATPEGFFFVRKLEAVAVSQGIDEVRGYLEKGQTWQARALAAEKRLADAYARLRMFDEREALRKLEASNG